MTKIQFGRGGCEPTLVRQVLSNLVQNAARAIGPGGNVTLSSEVGAQRWTLTVCDDGPGIPAEHVERIFERFVQLGRGTSVNGHGLGLPICRSIAQLHGGTVTAENRADRSGLRVVVDLPRRGYDGAASRGAELSS